MIETLVFALVCGALLLLLPDIVAHLVGLLMWPDEDDT